MKPNTFLRRHSIKLAILGSLAFAAQVACSDDPAPGVGGVAGTTNGGSNTAGSGTAGSNTAGSGTGGSGTAGSGTAGSNTAGTFTTAGTETGGTATGGTGGTGTAGTATAGTGGTGIIPVDPFCMGKTLTALPYNVTEGFKQSGWGGVIASTKTGAQIVPAPAVDYCGAGKRVAGAVGDCSMWQWTPAANATENDYSFVAWARMWDAQYTHPEVCLADGAKYISFYARGEVGGEKLKFGGSEATDITVTLTAEWKLYSISLDGVTYNSFASGFEKGFAWTAAPPTAKITFWVDNIQVVKTLPADPSGGGEGGAGGAGGAGG